MPDFTESSSHFSFLVKLIQIVFLKPEWFKIYLFTSLRRHEPNIYEKMLYNAIIRFISFCLIFLFHIKNKFRYRKKISYIQYTYMHLNTTVWPLTRTTIETNTHRWHYLLLGGRWTSVCRHVQEEKYKSKKKNNIFLYIRVLYVWCELGTRFEYKITKYTPKNITLSFLLYFSGNICTCLPLPA